MIKLITAVDEEGGIGKEGSIPWYYPKDLKFFRFMTKGNKIIMGRKTFDNIGSLPEREMLVLSRKFQGGISGDGHSRYVSWEDLLGELNQSDQDIYICGGQEVYEQTLDFVEQAFISRIPGSYDCDRFMPIIENDFSKISEMAISEEITVEKWIK